MVSKILFVLLFFSFRGSSEARWLDTFKMSAKIRVPQLVDRIVGGSPADILLYPYQVSLNYRKNHICGGSLISERWVVSAAHCTVNGISQEFSVRAGSTNSEKGGVVRRVFAIHDHPDFNYSIYDYDITLLDLRSGLRLGKHIAVVKLPAQKNVVALKAGNVEATATGWGKTETGNYSDHQLRAVKVPVLTNEVCARLYAAKNQTITERMLCAGLVDAGGKDTCQGDSGGPLVIGSKPGTLIGVTSWGWGCAQPKLPGVYSNVSSLTSFITEVTGITIN